MYYFGDKNIYNAAADISSVIDHNISDVGVDDFYVMTEVAQIGQYPQTKFDRYLQRLEDAKILHMLDSDGLVGKVACSTNNGHKITVEILNLSQPKALDNSMWLRDQTLYELVTRYSHDEHEVVTDIVHTLQLELVNNYIC